MRIISVKRNSGSTLSVAMLAFALLQAAPIFSLDSALSTESTLTADATEQDPPRVALILAGGSAFGLAHIGAIRVLEELGLPIDLVVGTSMGAVVGGFYALGHDAASLEAVAKATDWNDLLSESGPVDPSSWSEMNERSRYVGSIGFDAKGFSARGGVISGKRIVRFLDSTMMGSAEYPDFDAFPRRFRAVATDIATGSRAAFDRGSLPDAIRASMSIPGVFSPWKVGASWYVDGGAVDNLPIDVARELGAEIVIAIDLYDGSAFDPEALERTPLPAISRSFDYLLGATSRPQYDNADLVIPIDLAGMSRADFSKVDDFIAVGEKTARALTEELLALAARVEADDSVEGQKRDGEERDRVNQESRTRASQTRAITAVTSENAKTGDACMADDAAFIQKAARYAAERAGMSAVGNTGGVASFATADPESRMAFLGALSSRLDRSGRFETIRYASKPNGDGSDTLIVRTTARKRDENALRLGFVYESTISSAITGNLGVVPALSIGGLTTPDSRLDIDAEIVDSPGVDIRFTQPVGFSLSVIPSYRYSHDFETRLTGSSIGYQYQTTISSLGLALALEAVPGAIVTAGVSYDWLSTVVLPGVTGESVSTATAIADAGIRVNTLDFPVFPMDGALASLSFRASIPFNQAVRPFRVLSTDGSTFLSLNTPFSVALLWEAGTDFSVGEGDPDAAPPYYRPDLANRRLFPGPLQVTERIGSHVIAAGLEAKNNLNWGSKGITIPVFFLAHVAVGAVIADLRDINPESDVYHWNAAAGFGARVGETFAVEARAGVHRNGNNEYLPFIALDIGAIGY